MKFMTPDYVKQEAAKGEIQALYCSLMHHQQGRDCTRGELIDAIEDGVFGVQVSQCACCCWNMALPGETDCKRRKDCPLYKDNHCCDGLWRKLVNLLGKFKTTPTPANFTAFQEAEKAVCDYIQAVIDKKAEPEPATWRKTFYGDEANLATMTDDGGRNVKVRCSTDNGTPIYMTCTEAQEVCDGFQRVIDNAKQAKVGEKSEQGKSEEKLRDGDYYYDGCSHIVIAKKDNEWVFGYGDGTYAENDESGILERINHCGYKRIGNIFDDMRENK